MTRDNQKSKIDLIIFFAGDSFYDIFLYHIKKIDLIDYFRKILNQSQHIIFDRKPTPPSRNLSNSLSC